MYNSIIINDSTSSDTLTIYNFFCKDSNKIFVAKFTSYYGDKWNFINLNINFVNFYLNFLMIDKKYLEVLLQLIMRFCLLIYNRDMLTNNLPEIIVKLCDDYYQEKILVEILNRTLFYRHNETIKYHDLFIKKYHNDIDYNQTTNYSDEYIALLKNNFYISMNAEIHKKDINQLNDEQVVKYKIDFINVIYQKIYLSLQNIKNVLLEWIKKMMKNFYVINLIKSMNLLMMIKKILFKYV